MYSSFTEGIKDSHLAYIGASNQRHASDCVITTFSCEKHLIFLTSRKYVYCGIKVNLNILALERVIRGAFNFNGCKELEKNSFNNILSILSKISVVFEVNSTNNSSADTSLDTFRFYQKFKLK